MSKRNAEQQHQITTLEMFARCVGRDMPALEVTVFEWDRYRSVRTSRDPTPDATVLPELQGRAIQAAGPLLRTAR